MGRMTTRAVQFVLDLVLFLLAALVLAGAQRPSVPASQPGRPADVDLPRPAPREYPPPPRRPQGARAAGTRGLFWQQDSQSLQTVQAYGFGVLVDKSTKPVALAATCAAQALAQVFGCSAAFVPSKGTHTYRIQTTCPFCAPTIVQSDPITLTY